MNYDELARVALSFILEAECWPVFLSWCAEQPHSDEMVAWLKTASVHQTRIEWMRNSPDPAIRALVDG